jgi:hypothetical protein
LVDLARISGQGSRMQLLLAQKYHTAGFLNLLVQ